MAQKKIHPVRNSDRTGKPKRRTSPASVRSKRAGRIPDVFVGDEVNTSVGEKKKVCFNIGGKWVFRMVDTDWRAPGRPTKKRKSKVERRKEGEEE